MLTPEEIHSKVEALALPLLADAGLDLVELRVVLRNKDALLFFTADRPQGGITIEECARANRAIVEAIDREGFLGEDYELEFASPGLDRPLATQKDFARNLNRAVRLLLSEPVGGKKEMTGIVAAADAQAVVVRVKRKKETAAITVPLSSITKAVLVI